MTHKVCIQCQKPLAAYEGVGYVPDRGAGVRWVFCDDRCLASYLARKLKL